MKRVWRTALRSTVRKCRTFRRQSDHLNPGNEREVECLSVAALDHLQHVLATASLFKESFQIYLQMAVSKILKFDRTSSPLAGSAGIVAIEQVEISDAQLKQALIKEPIGSNFYQP